MTAMTVMDEIRKVAKDLQLDIVGLQEPYITRGGKIPQMPVNARIVVSGKSPMSAVVVFNKHLTITRVDKLCNERVTCVEEELRSNAWGIPFQIATGKVRPPTIISTLRKPVKLGRISEAADKTPYFQTKTEKTRDKVVLNRNLRVKIDGQTIRRSKGTRYLGVMLDERRHFMTHVENVCGRALRSMNKIISTGQGRFKLSMRLIRLYHQTMLVSIVGYGAGIWPLNLELRRRAALYWIRKGDMKKVASLTRAGITTGLQVRKYLEEEWQDEWEWSKTGRRTHKIFPSVAERLGMEYRQPFQGALIPVREYKGTTSSDERINPSLIGSSPLGDKCLMLGWSCRASARNQAGGPVKRRGIEPLMTDYRTLKARGHSTSFRATQAKTPVYQYQSRGLPLEPREHGSKTIRRATISSDKIFYLGQKRINNAVFVPSVQSAVEPMQVDAAPEDNDNNEEEPYIVENSSMASILNSPSGRLVDHLKVVVLVSGLVDHLKVVVLVSGLVDHLKVVVLVSGLVGHLKIVVLVSGLVDHLKIVVLVSGLVDHLKVVVLVSGLVDHLKIVVLDLEAYTNSYTGLARLYRLIYIADHCPTLRLEALKMAVTYIMGTYNVALYQQLHKKLQDAIGLPDIASGGAQQDLPTLDLMWVESKSKKAALKLEKLDTDLKNYKSNSIKESIRRGHDDLGDHYLDCGDLSNALKCYSRARDYCTSGKHVVNMCLNVIKVSVYLQNWSHVLSYVSKAEATPDFTEVSSAPSGTLVLPRNSVSNKEEVYLHLHGEIKRNSVHGKDSNNQTILTRLKCAAGLAELATKKYKSAAKHFLAANFDHCDFPELLSASNVAMYGGLCALATFHRHELQKNVIFSSSFKLFLELEPQLRDIIFKFYESKYASCLKLLGDIKENLLLDMYIAPHVNALYTQIRNRALIQYFSPYLSADMHRMADSFNTTVLALEDELMQLILEGQIQARIDSHNKILYAKEVDQRSTTFEKSVAVGKEYQRRTRMLILRAAMLKHQIHVKSPQRDSGQGGEMSVAPGNSALAPRN
uniref:PCI domain-containing protein n=1 Tax=Timema bartmani TaxID=61472 RepID=A0A7R9EU98_9NEOP|nr:unnamed protein product [Timema bartmani]